MTASYSYPLNGQVLTLEFKENGDLFFKENDKTYSETKFSITKDTLNYYENNEMERIYLFRISTDTLTLTNPFTLGDFSFYKRIK